MIPEIRSTLSSADVGSPEEAVVYLNKTLIPTMIAALRALNEIVSQLNSGELGVGSGQITVGSGAPSASTPGNVYVNIALGASPVLYVCESGTWVGK